jgi:hypothetical protein
MGSGAWSATDPTLRVAVSYRGRCCTGDELRQNEQVVESGRGGRPDFATEGTYARGHRSGGGTAAKKLQVELAVLCQLADRDVKGEPFFRQYYQSNLNCTLVLQRRYLPTYSAPVPARVAILLQFLTTAHYVFKQAEFSL